MNRNIVPIEEIKNLEAVAENLTGLLSLDCNDDLDFDFPNTRRRYTVDAEHTLARLNEEVSYVEPGVREMFIARVGSLAVVMGVVVKGINTPECVDSAAPEARLGRLCVQTTQCPST